MILLALSALNLTAQTPTPAEAKPSFQPAIPESAEERSYVRRLSAGISFGLAPFNTFPKTTVIDKVTGPPVVEKDSAIDPKSNRVGIGLTLQATFGRRLALAVLPTYRKVAFHAFVKQFVGTDNASTFLDERAETDINEDTTARFYELPLLLRLYNIGHQESGKRWFFEVGPNLRMTTKVNTNRDTVPPKGDRFKDNLPIEFRKNTLGFTAGVGGQFIDDFGIRAIPEIRYTYWLNKPFDSYHGKSRTSQLEIVFTLSF